MEKGELETRILNLIEDIFDLGVQKPTFEMDRDSIEDWDSLGHFRLVTAIEQEFSITIPSTVGVDWKDLKSIYKYLESIL